MMSKVCIVKTQKRFHVTRRLQGTRKLWYKKIASQVEERLFYMCIPEFETTLSATHSFLASSCLEECGKPDRIRLRLLRAPSRDPSNAMAQQRYLQMYNSTRQYFMLCNIVSSEGDR